MLVMTTNLSVDIRWLITTQASSGSAFALMPPCTALIACVVLERPLKPVLANSCFSAERSAVSEYSERRMSFLRRFGMPGECAARH